MHQYLKEPMTSRVRLSVRKSNWHAARSCVRETEQYTEALQPADMGEASNSGVNDMGIVSSHSTVCWPVHEFLQIQNNDVARVPSSAASRAAPLDLPVRDKRLQVCSPAHICILGKKGGRVSSCGAQRLFHTGLRRDSFTR